MWFCEVFPEEPQGTGRDFSCPGGTSVSWWTDEVTWWQGWFLATQTWQPDPQFFSLQSLWNLLETLHTSQRDFYMEK